MKTRTDFVLENIGQLLTMSDFYKSDIVVSSAEIGLIKNATMALNNGKIVWVGPNELFSKNCILSNDCKVVSAKNQVVTPGFVDSHTHPLFGKTRAEEFAMRASGADYEAIAVAGGGILNSVKKTRAAADSVLFENANKYLSNMLSFGTTTVEVKSGYGLDLNTELRCLDVAKRVSKITPQTIVPTFLGAHEVPLEFKGKADEYIDFLISEVNPAIRKQGIAKFVDIFCEKGVFTTEQARKYLIASSKQGFKLKIHADEFYDTNGAAIAVETGAVSADHLLSISKQNIDFIASSDTVATLLPGTALFLNKPFPPGRQLLDAGATVALATDFNPGSCFCDSMPLIISLAVCQCGFTVEEALVSATRNGAKALDLQHKKGSLAVGFDADYVIWNCDDYKMIPYHIGKVDIEVVSCNNQIAYRTQDKA